MGYLHLLGVEGLVDRDVNIARRWFELGKDMGDAEASYSYAMLRLGWMVTEVEGLPKEVPTWTASSSTNTRKRKTAFDQSYLVLLWEEYMQRLCSCISIKNYQR